MLLLTSLMEGTISDEEQSDKKDTEHFKELKVDRTHDANCMISKQDDKIEGESKDCSICKQEGNLLRKMKLGVHAVSEGVESVFDARECSSDNEVGKKREYLVKYKDLAHVHNRWITEKQLHLEAPVALGRFKKNWKSVSWKTEWSLPHRLLDKRILAEVHGIDENHADCHYEWLVKWTGLGYSHVTWELENASFLKSLEAVKLMTDYEIRHQQAKKEISDTSQFICIDL
ncbi:hypothetical protein RND71_028803 [Anisodus tanguticus]|uniref:Chromo domain-containing protein n=1 Tax=Anisodus tanguticus TaxID=243964 RepID=A0AAE1RJ35_9SOLA|nr:hypothetical protein RND71_028803 [Anisodus tanguticus]